MKKIISLVTVAVIILSSIFIFSGCSSTEQKSIKSVDDLTGASIGVQLGTTGDIYASDVKKAKISRYNKGSDAISALTQNKIDCVIIDNEPAKEYVKANSGLKILNEPFAEEEYAMCVAKNNHSLTVKLNKALATIKKNGTLQKIINNFIGNKAGKSPYKSPAGIKYKGELHMATNPEFPPYEYSENAKVVGIDPMVAQALCDQMGYKLVIDSMDFDSIITAVSTGKSDFGMAGMTVTDERKKSIDFTDTYTSSKQVIIVNDGGGSSLFGSGITESFKKTFINENRWKQLLDGLVVSLEITAVAAIIGILLGFIIALIRSTYDLQQYTIKSKGVGYYILKFLNFVCNIYVTVIRGTPVVIQLMIMYYIVFSSMRYGIIAAFIAFGMNSAAYVAEVMRSGIMSIDRGQIEASRSLGFSHSRTMLIIVLPQAIKNVLPALGNELITLLKETSVAGYVALADITYVGNLIRSRTYEAFFPLITVAAIYLVIVLLLTYLLRVLERRLQKNEK